MASTSFLISAMRSRSRAASLKRSARFASKPDTVCSNVSVRAGFILCPSLPVTAPIRTLGIVQRQAERAERQRAVVEAAVIFNPSRVRGVLMKVASRYVVVLAFDHLAEPREKRLRLIGARAV